MKPRCSIIWCPWKGKYSYGIEGYHECWFHGGDMLWLELLWDTVWVPMRYFYLSLRYGFNVYGGIINWYKLTWGAFIEERKLNKSGK